jgi:geranylgeranyl diphosphate synthase, type I
VNMLSGLKKDIDLALVSYLEEADRRIGLKRTSPALYSGISEFTRRGGKRIRPILFVLSCMGYDDKKLYPYEKLLRSSLAFELLHAFLLVHDDVIDSSSLRRGKPTLHRVFNKKLRVAGTDPIGSSLAIVAGDVIFALAVEALMSINAPGDRKEMALLEFTKVMASTGMGEFIDVVNNITPIENVKKRDVLLTYILKTAKYTFESPLTIGAFLAGADKKEIGKISRLGIMLGQAFQLEDDMLDIFSTSKKTGKPILSDLDESKKTLLVWKAYERLKAPDRKTLSRILSKKRKSRADLVKVRDLIKKSGSHVYCRDLAMSLLRESRNIVSGLKMRSEYKKALGDLIDMSFPGDTAENRIRPEKQGPR